MHCGHRSIASEYLLRASLYCFSLYSWFPSSFFSSASLSGDRIVFKLLRLGAGSGLLPAVWGNDIFLEAGIGLFKLLRLFKFDLLESLEYFLNSLFVLLVDLLCKTNSVDVLILVLLVLLYEVFTSLTLRVTVGLSGELILALA